MHVLLLQKIRTVKEERSAEMLREGVMADRDGRGRGGRKRLSSVYMNPHRRNDTVRRE